MTLGKICFSVDFKQTGLIRFDRHTDMCTHICIIDFRMLPTPLTVSVNPSQGVLVFWYQIPVKRSCNDIQFSLKSLILRLSVAAVMSFGNYFGR